MPGSLGGRLHRTGLRQTKAHAGASPSRAGGFSRGPPFPSGDACPPRLYLEHGDDGPQQGIKVLPVGDRVSGVCCQAELAPEEVHAQDAKGRTGWQGGGQQVSRCSATWPSLPPGVALPRLPHWPSPQLPALQGPPCRCPWPSHLHPTGGKTETGVGETGACLAQPAWAVLCPSPSLRLDPTPGWHTVGTQHTAGEGCPHSFPDFLGTQILIHPSGGPAHPPTRLRACRVEPTLGSHRSCQHTEGQPMKFEQRTSDGASANRGQSGGRSGGQAVPGTRPALQVPTTQPRRGGGRLPGSRPT